jgi:gentisate 1,2-dioxygenase
MSERQDAALISALEEVNFQPLWDRFQVLTPMNPEAKDKAFVWRWDDIEPLTVRAGQEVAMEDAERRAVIMCHPAFDGKIETTANLISAFTVLEPGDKAPPHRHTAAAIRFATRCEGAVTIVNGRRCEMHEGDLVLTPPMCWHGHINEGDERTTWFDAANMPLIGHLDANFFEPGDRDANDFWQVGKAEEDVWEGAGLLAVEADTDVTHSPKYRYPGEVTQATLNAMRPAEDGSKTLRYISPISGGPVMPTMDCYYQRIAGGQSTRNKRVTYNQICLVAKGEGRSNIGGETIEWSRHDTFSIPHWAWASHEAADGDAEFFIVSDKSIFENLDLIREEVQD